MASASAAMAESRADMAVHPAGDARIADLPAGHWATNATQVVIANNVLTLQDGAFNGNAKLSGADLDKAMDSLTSIAEAIAGKGSNSELRAAIGTTHSDGGDITRIQLAETLASFLDACSAQQLVAIAASNNDAARFKDTGAAVPKAVSTVVDQYKVMTGYPDNTFRPSDTVTRYQMAAIAYNILNTMKMAPIAQLPVAVPEPAAPVVIVVHEDKPATVAAVPELPKVRDNFRQRAPFHLDWQAVNSDNITNGTPFGAVPLTGMITGYQGPVMLQNVTNVRINVFQDNMIDSEFRVGLSTLKYGMFQIIPYVGADVSVGTSIPVGGTQYDTYVGATYGTILSVMPTDNIEVFGTVGQNALLAGGRFNQTFAATNYPTALGTLLSNYGVGVDFYVSPTMCLTVGLNNWQDPASLRTGTNDSATGNINTLGGSIGIGSSF